jgi:hypothetical protein
LDFLTADIGEEGEMSTESREEMMSDLHPAQIWNGIDLAVHTCSCDVYPLHSHHPGFAHDFKGLAEVRSFSASTNPTS